MNNREYVASIVSGHLDSYRFMLNEFIGTEFKEHVTLYQIYEALKLTQLINKYPEFSGMYLFVIFDRSINSFLFQVEDNETKNFTNTILDGNPKYAYMSFALFT